VPNREGTFNAKPEDAMDDLTGKRCVPCEAGMPPLANDEVRRLAAQVPTWRVHSDGTDRLEKRFSFPDFVTAIAFVNRMAQLAESEGHHPDFCVRYAHVDVSIWTHVVRGLSENDFILAAKLDRL
jgi:4a-hydroxytetrahydrobiopterin dehydratase